MKLLGSSQNILTILNLEKYLPDICGARQTGLYHFNYNICHCIIVKHISFLLFIYVHIKLIKIVFWNEPRQYEGIICCTESHQREALTVELFSVRRIHSTRRYKTLCEDSCMWDTISSLFLELDASVYALVRKLKICFITQNLFLFICKSWRYYSHDES